MRRHMQRFIEHDTHDEENRL